MGDLIKVKFKEAGKWADSPSEPVFDVEKDEVKEVSSSFANMLVEAGKGKIVKRAPVGKTEDDKKPDDENPDKDDNEPKDGDACKLENGKDGVIKNGECVKKGFLG